MDGQSGPNLPKRFTDRARAVREEESFPVVGSQSIEADFVHFGYWRRHLCAGRESTRALRGLLGGQDQGRKVDWS